MANRLAIPKFSSEDEEVEWYDRHKKEVEGELVRRMKAGDVIVRRRNPRTSDQNDLIPITIRLSKGDIEAARKLAAHQGIGYQTYLRVILRQALRRASVKK
jgi:predicted DNA binding CopG/RHH family protein